MRFPFVAAFGAIAVCSPLMAAELPKTLDDAEKISQATGRPLLIVAGSST